MGKRARASRANDQDDRTPSLRVTPATEGVREREREREGERKRGNREHRIDEGGGEEKGTKCEGGRVRPITQADGANQGAMRLP